MTILLTGGTGKTALPTARRLQHAGHSVLLACRSGNVPAPYRGVAFDWFDSKTFKSPFDLDSNIDRIYLVCPYAPDLLGIVKPFIELAISKGVKRFVLLSSTRQERGGSYTGKVHEYIEDLGVEWAVIRPTWFMENFSTIYLNPIRNDNCIPTSMREGRVPFIAADDIAELVYHALTDEKSHNVDHLIVGPDAYTHDEAATMFSEILGRKIEHIHLSEEQGNNFWIALGLPELAAQFMVALEHTTAHDSEFASMNEPTDGKVIGRTRLPEYVNGNRRLWE